MAHGLFAMAVPIFIVDDNPVNLKLVRFLLESEGYEVRTAGDASELMELLRKFLPRLIILDIQLPGMDGLTLTRHLKADPRTRNIIIVAMTAYAMKGDADQALKAGCDGYIAKPIDTNGLPDLVAHYLSRSPRTP
jgi:CheY-like chemotaxis protein